MSYAIKTNYGEIVIELYPKKAPKTVKNFLRYVDEKFYKDVIFHRVVNNFIIQAGGFEHGMQQKSTYDPIENEAKNGLRNSRGMISMARLADNPHSATSQFFINITDNDFLNYNAPTPDGWGYCVFGKVTDGMHVVDKIKDVPTGNRYGFSNVPYDDIVIESVTKKGIF